MIKIGTDCSGIEAPIQALNNLGINYEHIFSCEIDKYAIKSIEANYKPKYLYKDIYKEKENHYLDIYVCGFPCQPFSTSGKRLGSKDPRGNIFEECIKTIKNTKTKVFILENVKGIISIEKGEYWKYIINTLSELEDYDVYYKVLNTKDYGIPQNRERVYIIGIMKNIQTNHFTFPSHLPMNSINFYVDKYYTKNNNYANTFLKSHSQFKDAIFANLSVLRHENINNKVNPNYCPTITSVGQMWCIPMQRKATVTELLSLQGFPKDFKQVVSDTQIKKQIGNSMSVNVLECIFKEIFKCVNF